MSLDILAIFGTRPEAIKMAPVVKAANKADHINCRVCVTAQHRHMLDQVLELFDIVPDYDLDLMTRGQDLFDITSKSLLGIRDVLNKERPDFILVQGDTTTCFAGALAGFYENIIVGHVEAGLRTGNIYAPFPEEMNRVLAARLTTLHFTPTEISRDNLLQEGIRDENIWVTGNTIIDALLDINNRINNVPDEYFVEVIGEELFKKLSSPAEKRILITGHRRENFGKGFIDLCDAIKYLANTHPEWTFVYPVHLNPNVRDPVYNKLGNSSNIYLIEPLEYMPFVWLMNSCDIVLTDSGGIQEEAPGLGKPVLVMREVTERPEGVDAGTVRLVGTDTERIIQGVEKVLLNNDVYLKMAKAHNPYGDGKASERILDAIVGYIGN